MMAKCVDTHQRDWDQHLLHISFCYNASVHESTQHSPFFLMHGFEPRWDADLKLGEGHHTLYSSDDYADLLITRLEDAYNLTRDHLHVVAGRMQDWYDRKVHVQRFEVGEEVSLICDCIPVSARNGPGGSRVELRL